MQTLQRSTWHLTHHAQQRMLDRGISAVDLDRLLRNPQRVVEDMKRRWVERPLHYYAGFSLLALVNVASREIVTVGHDGASSSDWQQHCREAAGRYAAGVETVELAALMDGLDAAERRARAMEPRAARARRTAPRRGSAVATRNVLDDVAPALRPSILAQCGGDLRRLRIISRTCVEVV